MWIYNVKGGYIMTICDINYHVFRLGDDLC